MDYELIIRPKARSDLLDAFHWYQEQRPGLGLDFKLCVDEVISKLQKHPSIYKKIHRDVRRAIIKRFPFGVLHRKQQYNNCSCCFACKERSSQVEKQNITIVPAYPNRVKLGRRLNEYQKQSIRTFFRSV